MQVLESHFEFREGKGDFGRNMGKWDVSGIETRSGRWTRFEDFTQMEARLTKRGCV
jgi:hypothetical protein